MKFEIRGDKEKIGHFLDMFISAVAVEFEKQRGVLSRVGMGGLVMAQDWFDKGGHILYVNTMPSALPFLFTKRLVRNMERDLMEFLVENGCRVESVKYAGD